MTKLPIAVSLLLCASPALAQPAPAPGPEGIALPPELTDPATADRIAGMMQVLSKAVLDMPVGQLKAAVEGREASPAERHMTVRDMDPKMGRDIQRQVAEARPALRQSMKALNDALPAVMQGLEQASRALERAAANMPDPTYPRR